MGTSITESLSTTHIRQRRIMTNTVQAPEKHFTISHPRSSKQKVTASNREGSWTVFWPPQETNTAVECGENEWQEHLGKKQMSLSDPSRQHKCNTVLQKEG